MSAEAAEGVPLTHGEPSDEDEDDNGRRVMMLHGMRAQRSACTLQVFAAAASGQPMHGVSRASHRCCQVV
jgi:hypothetical protein